MIQFKRAENEQKLEEWSIIELQGDLEVDSGESLTNKFMGDLHFNNDVPIIILGHHVLYGKAMPLEKPFVLLKKEVTTIESKRTSNQDDENEKDKMELDSESNQTETKTKTTYVIKAVIKRKLLFNKRPRPIVYVESKGRN